MKFFASPLLDLLSFKSNFRRVPNFEEPVKEDGLEVMRLNKTITLGFVISSLLSAKTMANCRPRYIDSLRLYLHQFARGREEHWIGSFDVVSIDEWFRSRNETHSTMAGNVGRLSALFGFAERRGWVHRNPCKQLERIRVDRKPPFILNVSQARKLMGYIAAEKPNELAYFSLAMFAGVRPEELERISWDAIRIEPHKTTVTIDAAASKVRRRRIIEVEPTTEAWLRRAREAGARLPVRRMTRRRYLDHVERVLGFETWPQDCLRHTAASYLLARHHNANLVADKLGNSATILLRHYRELVSAEDCLAFWSIVP